MKSSFVSVFAASVALLTIAAMPSMATHHYYFGQSIDPASNHANGGGARTFIRVIRPSRYPKRLGAIPLGGDGPGGGISPAQVAGAYHLTPAGSLTIAVVDAYDLTTALTDFNIFSAEFGLPQETSTNVLATTNKVFQKVYANGTQPPSAYNYGWDAEEELDMQWSHAMAPKAKILLIEANSTGLGDLLAAVDKAVSLKAKEVSMSWGFSEFPTETTLGDKHFPTGKGTVFFASSGDSGAFFTLDNENYAIYPTTSPNVVSVGGTTFATDADGNFLYELGWEFGGGGVSAVEKKPTYQNGVANTDPTYRSIPDIAAIADSFTGVAVYIGDYPSPYTSYNGWYVVGGTSVACPVIAAITNSAGHFLKDSVVENTKIYGGIGGVNFSDIQFGYNGFSGGVGWDPVTGVGTPYGLGGL